MRDEINMALIVSDSDRPSPKVWQPWYMGEAEGVGKELASRVNREHRIKARTNLQKSPRHPPSCVNEGDERPVGASRARYAQHGCYIVTPDASCYDHDAPLDMSIKRRSPTPAYTPPPPPIAHSYTPPPPTHLRGHSPSLPPPPAHTPSTAMSGSPPPYLRHPYISHTERPSVITCASPHYLPHIVSADEEGAPAPRPSLPPPPPSYSAATAHLRHPSPRHVPRHPVEENEQLFRIVSRNGEVSPCPETVPSRSRSPSPPTEGKRHVVQGAGDPEIDEHFRRSLGMNYQQLFVSSSSEEAQDSNDSVDDHFTKALGETWMKFKGQKKEAPPVRRPSDCYSPRSLPPPAREHVLLGARSATPPEPIYKGTPDVSITRVAAPTNNQRPFLSQLSRLAHLSS